MPEIAIFVIRIKRYVFLYPTQKMHKKVLKLYLLMKDQEELAQRIPDISRLRMMIHQQISLKSVFLAQA
jgi:hypothetical protein